MKKKLMSILSTVVIIILMCVIGVSSTTTAAETQPISTTAATETTTEKATFEKIKINMPKAAKKSTVKAKKKTITKKKKKKKSIYVKSKKYPIAARIWNNLRKQGYSKKVTAGIMGNIMAECGGQTLNIQPYLYSGNYYGICQWSLEYHPGIAGANLIKQLKLLKRTIKPEFDNFGFVSGYTYKQFKKIKNEKTAALAFAKTYERCASCSYYIRQVNATKAYKYFCKK